MNLTEKDTINDMRKKHGLDPIPEGNITLTQSASARHDYEDRLEVKTNTLFKKERRVR